MFFTRACRALLSVLLIAVRYPLGGVPALFISSVDGHVAHFWSGLSEVVLLWTVWFSSWTYVSLSVEYVLRSGVAGLRDMHVPISLSRSLLTVFQPPRVRVQVSRLSGFDPSILLLHGLLLSMTGVSRVPSLTCSWNTEPDPLRDTVLMRSCLLRVNHCA